MKNLLLFVALTLLSTIAFCQSNKNDLSFVFSNAGNSITRGGFGAAGYTGQGALLYGLNYDRTFTNHFALETGVEYSVNNVLWDYVDYYSTTFVPQKVRVEMMTVPIYGNISFAKYFFVNGGFVASFETSHQPAYILEKQSGVGVGIGAGAKYDVNNIVLFVNPFLRHVNTLNTHGVKFGVGY